MGYRVPRSALERLTEMVNAVSEAEQAQLSSALLAIDYTQPGWVDQVVAVMEHFCGTTDAMCATLGAEFYDAVREYATGQRLGAVASSGRKPEATERAVRGIVQRGVDGDVDGMQADLLSRVDYEAKRGIGDTMYANGERDPKRPRFARVPTGAETCAFCMMLASRGFVYRSRKSAGADGGHYHAHCNCRIVPEFGAESGVEGYDPDEWYQRWLDSKKPAGGQDR